MVRQLPRMCSEDSEEIPRRIRIEDFRQTRAGKAPTQRFIFNVQRLNGFCAIDIVHGLRLAFGFWHSCISPEVSSRLPTEAAQCFGHLRQPSDVRGGRRGELLCCLESRTPFWGFRLRSQDCGRRMLVEMCGKAGSCET